LIEWCPALTGALMLLDGISTHYMLIQQNLGCCSSKMQESFDYFKGSKKR